jgi:hypothetical protein
MPPHEPPKKPGKVVNFRPAEKTVHAAPPHDKVREVATLQRAREDLAKWERDVQGLHSESRAEPISPINFAIRLGMALEDMPLSIKRRYRELLIAIAEKAVSYSNKYPVQTHFDILRSHIRELRKM